MSGSRLLLAVALLAIVGALAWSSRERAETPDERVARITSELRCVVCQGLSVRDSPSESARQMRERVEQRVSEGWTDDQIRDEFRASYGDWIILTPPLVSWSGLVWLVPLLALLAGVAFAWRRLRAPPALPPEGSAAEVAALRERVSREEAVDAPAVDA